MNNRIRFTPADFASPKARALLPPGDPLALGAGKPAAGNPVTGAPKKSPLAVKFEQMWAAIDGPAYAVEHAFAEDRRFRFDYAWPCKVALELQGGIHLAGKGGHVSPKGVRNDCEKACLAASLDWRLFKLATGQVTFENLQRIKAKILSLPL